VILAVSTLASVAAASRSRSVADGEGVFVGPDNGLLAPQLRWRRRRACRRVDQRGVSPAVARRDVRRSRHFARVGPATESTSPSSVT
jgi:S-adenosylmethionine hydrolase